MSMTHMRGGLHISLCEYAGIVDDITVEPERVTCFECKGRLIANGRIALSHLQETPLSTPQKVTDAHKIFKELVNLTIDHHTEPIYRAALDAAIDELFRQIHELQRAKS